METGRTLRAERQIEILTQWGEQLQQPDNELNQRLSFIQAKNGWFSPENVRQAVTSIGQMLNRDDLQHWFSLQASSSINQDPKKVGLVLAGNIPAVGFHDILCVLASGHHALIKLSADDQIIIPYLLEKLIAIEPAVKSQIHYVDRLKCFDAVVATGSNNTSRYFDYYFRNVPHIIRKNRNSVAILKGDETPADLALLGQDIFNYFGLGCRNVSKLYVPQGYNFAHFFEGIESFQPIHHHSKYNNNYDYNKSILLVNREPHLDNGFILLKESEALSSPLATLHYETYIDFSSVKKKIESLQDQIQCVVSGSISKFNISQVHFGDSQKPKLWDYADGVNTLAFLSKLGVE